MLLQRKSHIFPPPCLPPWPLEFCAQLGVVTLPPSYRILSFIKRSESSWLYWTCGNEIKQECIPMGCVPPTLYCTRGVSVQGVSLNRDPPPRQRSPWHRIPFEQRPPQDRDPPRQRLPWHRTPFGETPPQDREFRIPTFLDWQNSMIFPGFLVNFQVFFHYFFHMNKKSILSTILQISKPCFLFQ